MCSGRHEWPLRIREQSRESQEQMQHEEYYRTAHSSAVHVLVEASKSGDCAAAQAVAYAALVISKMAAACSFAAVRWKQETVQQQRLCTCT
jgi:hypothetical protein